MSTDEEFAAFLAEMEPDPEPKPVRKVNYQTEAAILRAQTVASLYPKVGQLTGDDLDLRGVGGLIRALAIEELHAYYPHHPRSNGTGWPSWATQAQCEDIVLTVLEWLQP